METEKSQSESRSNERGLKRLGFVRVSAIHALVCVSSLYEYAKQSSGPLRSAIGTVERTVTAVIGPVYDKVKDVPDHLLSYLDNKVDQATHELDEHAPAAAKNVFFSARNLAYKAAEKAQKLISEAKTGGPWKAVSYAVNETKQIAVDQTANLWLFINKSNSVRPLARKAAPAMARLSGKYNSVVKGLTGKGYPVVGYLPLVPVEEISKAIEKCESGERKKKEDDMPVSDDRKSSSSSDSE